MPTSSSFSCTITRHNGLARPQSRTHADTIRVSSESTELTVSALLENDMLDVLENYESEGRDVDRRPHEQVSTLN